MRMKSFIEEFKAFAVKGNVIDLAVAVVIGAAFGKIVSSLVDNIIMPIVGMLVGGIDLRSLNYSVGSASIAYGTFLQAVVDFVIIALVIFVVIKAMNHAQELTAKKAAAAPATPAEPSDEVKLLREIRDSLRRP
jgi:large conductance mechanosensitive channel